MASPATITENFNANAADKISVNGYPFHRYNEDKLDELGYGRNRNRGITNSVDNYEKHSYSLSAVRNNSYNPEFHMNVPNPASGRDAYNRLKQDIENTINNPPQSILGSMPPEIRNDDILRKAFIVDLIVDKTLRQTGEFENVGGKKDHWAHPYTTVERGGGDCDDYATTKRKLLRELGTPDNHVYIMLGVDKVSDELHVPCLVVGQNGKSYVIDNNRPDKPAAVVPLDDYIKKYDFEMYLVMGDDSIFAIGNEDQQKVRKEREASQQSPAPQTYQPTASYGLGR